MTLAELCLPAFALLNLLCIGVAKFSAIRQFNNADPRNEAFYATGLRQRALGAQNNGFEAFPLFAAAVLLAEWRQGPQGLIDGLAAAFILVRIGYVAAYLGNKPSLRSLLWGLALCLSLAIFFTPIYAHGG